MTNTFIHSRIAPKPYPIPDQNRQYLNYRKIPKISAGAYIFQRPILRGLSREENLRFKIKLASLMAGRKSKAYFEGLIFGGAYLGRKICVSKSTWLALWLEENLLFFPCFTLYLRAISKYKTPGGLIFGGAYFRNDREGISRSVA